ncbi:hypothetical protein D3C84_843750 [compost metagenome]
MAGLAVEADEHGQQIGVDLFQAGQLGGIQRLQALRVDQGREVEMRRKHHVVAGAETDLVEDPLGRSIGGVLNLDPALFLERLDHAGRQAAFPAVHLHYLLCLRQTSPQAEAHSQQHPFQHCPYPL